ncbi:MAG: alkaline phosphatase D family protein [Candidatus Binatia bacterium]
MKQVDRRSFLKLASGAFAGATVGAGLSPLTRTVTGLVVPRSAFAQSSLLYPFTLGVASGDPLQDSVVLWTRLAPNPQEPGGGMSNQDVLVHWEVADDEQFRRVVREGEALAEPEDAHSVHVDVRGLSPARTYWYRFHAGGEMSSVGRTRTAPRRGAPLERFRFAFASCQDFEDGFYTAYQHLVQEEVDVVVFLGDYIYEDAPEPGSGNVRDHTGAGEPVTLEGYRIRYALYRSDPLLQAAHAALPWIVTFDDHEVDNDWSADIPQDPERQSRAQFLQRRAAAFKAYWEHMPLRPGLRPRGTDIQIYRRFTFGDLVEFNVLDTRQYRSVTEPCGYGTGPVCDAVLDPARTMLVQPPGTMAVRRPETLAGALECSRSAGADHAT